ncbi:phage tail sheath C-terminal domain-containing protein [Arthrobacter sp. H20]|uniref:phage tail sheath family protein n=1 Tax=Arthrobacter sp. H20 TaxID=1267981 RepID=UPI00047E5078|nr:phage tail sheath C-terminal domain-containing protein [Arthrobacter sp. H20]
MATTYKTPGAYVEEIPRFPPSVAAVDTAIPAFIGYTQRADDAVADDLRLKPKRIESFVEYEQYFGGAQPETKLTVSIDERTVATPGKSAGIQSNAVLAEADRSNHIMYYALQLFYANGGKSCFVVSVGPYKAAVGDDVVEGELEAGLTPLGKVDEPTLIVIPEAQSLAIADFATLHNKALEQCNALKDRFVIMDVHGDDESLSNPDADLIDAVAKFRTGGPGQYLKYGAAYAPNLETILDYAYDESAVQVSHSVDAGAPVVATLNTLGSQLIERARAAIRDLPLKLPPSPAMAGVYVKVDADRGVWKAPANVPLVAVIKPTIEFANVQNDIMNVDPTAGKSVNAIRAFVGKGTLVWGARTLAGNDNEWRYVNVRRFFNFVEESVKKAAEQFTFEPNDANTWVKVQAMIENFLTVQWRAGALQGIKPEHAFYVAVGLGKTMTPLDILEGRMIVEIGMAVVRPAEFIILRFSHKLAES